MVTRKDRVKNPLIPWVMGSFFISVTWEVASLKDWILTPIPVSSSYTSAEVTPSAFLSQIRYGSSFVSCCR